MTLEESSAARKWVEELWSATRYDDAQRNFVFNDVIKEMASAADDRVEAEIDDLKVDLRAEIKESLLEEPPEDLRVKVIEGLIECPPQKYELSYSTWE